MSKAKVLSSALLSSSGKASCQKNPAVLKTVSGEEHIPNPRHHTADGLFEQVKSDCLHRKSLSAK